MLRRSLKSRTDDDIDEVRKFDDYEETDVPALMALIDKLDKKATWFKLGKLASSGKKTIKDTSTQLQ